MSARAIGRPMVAGLHVWGEDFSLLVRWRRLWIDSLGIHLVH